MTKDSHSSALSTRGGHEWMLWLGRASMHMPDLRRAFLFLESSCELLDSTDESDLKNRNRRLKQAINRFLGQARSPSALSCEKIAIRTHIFDGWLQSELQRQSDPHLLVDLGAHALQKLLLVCEGANDKHGVLLKAVRDFTRAWLNLVSSHIGNQVERAHWVYPVAMLDQAGFVDPSWWWKQIALCDRPTVLGLVELEINGMSEMQPTNNVSWRSFDKRWRRLRLRGLLEHLGEKFLLAELLRKSAVDDFEAADAVKALREAGRSRDAIMQAEQWMRALPRSPVLASILFDLYSEDGWDEEALALAVTHHEYDPGPHWLNKLESLETARARVQAKDWRALYASSTVKSSK